MLVTQVLYLVASVCICQSVIYLLLKSYRKYKIDRDRNIAHYTSVRTKRYRIAKCDAN